MRMMTERTAFLRNETLTGANKIARCPMPPMSVADTGGSIPERKARALSRMFDEMPLFIGEQELIVGTRTYLTPHADNPDGHDRYDYYLGAFPTYLTQEESAKFGRGAMANMAHNTPDYGILLNKGVGGIIQEATERKNDPSLTDNQRNFLDSVIISYQGFSRLIGRYADYAAELAGKATGAEEKSRLNGIARVCRHIRLNPPENFREAIQLLWFGTLGVVIENFVFVCYGRLDVILTPFLKDTPHDEAQQLIDCLLLKMYDQADIRDGEYFGKYEGQLTVTLGGVLPDGTNAVSDVTLMFLDAIDAIKLPDPEFNLRLSRQNPPEFLDKAADMSIRGYNFISYYNDDLFVDSLTKGGLAPEDARSYGFDLCQDINIPGKGVFFHCGMIGLIGVLLDVLRNHLDCQSYEELETAFMEAMYRAIDGSIAHYNRTLENQFLYRDGKYEEYFQGIKNGLPSDGVGYGVCYPLPFLSGLFHGTVETATDFVFEGYPIKEKGVFLGTSVEAINSLSAIKKVVFEDQLYTLSQVFAACQDDYSGDGEEIMRKILWNAPKWGNDDPYADSIAKRVLEGCLTRIESHTTCSGGHVLGGIHQPHPVPNGKGLMATPDGRHQGVAVAVTLTPQSGTMKNGPTAALSSATVFNHELIQWNFCVMINYFASVFQGNDSQEIFKNLLTTYFEKGGMQHQPNVMDAEVLKEAQIHPEGYKDLIVRLWGVSAHFVDLSKEVQDEMIARLSA